MENGESGGKTSQDFVMIDGGIENETISIECMSKDANEVEKVIFEAKDN